jgi:hypothetical protein
MKSVLRCKFLILDTYHLDTLYLFEQRCEDPWLFFEAKGVQKQKHLEDTTLEDFSGDEI